MNPNPPFFKEVPLLHDLVADYQRYKTQGHDQTALRVLHLIKQTVDDVIEKPKLFAEPVQGVITTTIERDTERLRQATEMLNKPLVCTVAEVPPMYQGSVESTVEFSHKEEGSYPRPKISKR